MINDDRDAAVMPDSQQPADASSRKVGQFVEFELMQHSLWNVAETAFMCRVAARTVWRMLSDPKSKFPKPRRVRGRTLLARDEVLAFLAKGAR